MNTPFENPARAESLMPGGVYALSFKSRLSHQAMLNIRESIAPIEAKTKCTFLILDDGVAIGKLQNVSVVDGKLVVSENPPTE